MNKAFPCNQFMGQEPGTDAEIKSFAQDNMNAKFKLMSKIDVNNANTHPVYRYLRSNSKLFNEEKQQAEVIPWNFAKFLLNEQGQVVHYFEPRTNPLSFADKIEAMLG